MGPVQAIAVGPDQTIVLTSKIEQVLGRDGWDPTFVAWAKSQRTNSGYRDWTIGLVVMSSGVSREELRGVRWLAGKMLHFGPLPAVELKQWRPGAEPRWKWRASPEIYPRSRARSERKSEDRQAYDRYLAGRDLVGTFNLFDALHATEFLARELTRQEEP